MSLSIIFTRASLGINAPLITVEVHLSNGLPSLSIVGMPETVVKESKDRVRSAIINSHFEFPAKRITINLAPADLPKQGSRFDLPIAIGILAASQQITAEPLPSLEFIGELALSGELRKVDGTLPSAIASAKDKRRLITSLENASEAANYQQSSVLGGSNLLQVCQHIQGEQALQAAKVPTVEGTSYLHDFSDVKGQAFAKRALEIIAAGKHNLLMYGSPGTGKTMLATRLKSIMPELNTQEAIEVASIYSISQTANLPWREIPYRQPHHSSSSASLVGGGSFPKPGEISLAHNGILFLDEVAEFPRQVLETLREPLETGEINISRANAQLCFPAKFMLIAALNPCPCGYFGSRINKHECRCSPDQIKKYRQKISGPLLDRIDLHVAVSHSSATELQHLPKGEDSNTIKKRVVAARKKQLDRQQKANGELSNNEIETHCSLGNETREFFNKAIDDLGLSTRAYYRIIKTARTIADLSNSAHIEKSHLCEAMAFRNFNDE